MLKNLLYVFLCMIPFYGMGMEEGWESPESVNKDMFAKMRELVQKQSDDARLKTPTQELDNLLTKLENNFVKKHKESIGTFAHYSALYKMLGQLDDAVRYKITIGNIIAQYYLKYYANELTKNGLKVFQDKIGDQIITIIADNRRTLLNLISTGLTGAKQLFKTKKGKTEDLTASGFENIIPKVGFIERQQLTEYGPIIKESKSFEILKERGASISNDGVMYIKNRKFHGLVEADEVLFIANEKYSNGENEFEVLKQENKIAENVDKNSFESANSFFDSQQYKDAFYVKAPIVAILIDNIQECQTQVAGVSSQFNFFRRPISSALSIKAKNIVISENLAKEIKKPENKLAIKNQKNPDGSFATIDVIKYTEIKEDDWVELTSEIAAEHEGSKSTAEKHGEDIKGREKLPELEEGAPKQKEPSLLPNIELTIEQPEKIITPQLLTDEISKLQEINNEEADQITKEKQINIENASLRIIPAIKEKINEIKDNLYKNNTFVTDNCNLLLQISEYINELGDFENRMLHATKTEFIHYQLSKLIFKQNDYIVKLKTTDGYWVLIPKEAVRMINAIRTNLYSESVLLDYNINKNKVETETMLNELFNNKALSLESDTKKEDTPQILTTAEIKRWIKDRQLILYDTDKQQKINNFFDSSKITSIKNTLSVIAQSDSYLATGDILLALSEFITTMKNYSIDKSITTKQVVQNVIQSINEKSYQDKFVLIKSNDYAYFLVPRSFTRSIVDRKNNTEKNLIQSNVEFEWTRLHRVYVNAETLKAALDKCYKEGSIDLRSAIKNVEDSKKRWWNPFTWDWSSGYYFKKPTYERDYPERANQYSKEGNWAGPVE